jgi:hypothetical protein
VVVRRRDGHREAAADPDETDDADDGGGDATLLGRLDRVDDDLRGGAVEPEAFDDAFCDVVVVGGDEPDHGDGQHGEREECEQPVERDGRGLFAAAQHTVPIEEGADEELQLRGQARMYTVSGHRQRPGRRAGEQTRSLPCADRSTTHSTTIPPTTTSGHPCRGPSR